MPRLSDKEKRIRLKYWKLVHDQFDVCNKMNDALMRACEQSNDPNVRRVCSEREAAFLKLDKIIEETGYAK